MAANAAADRQRAQRRHEIEPRHADDSAHHHQQDVLGARLEQRPRQHDEIGRGARIERWRGNPEPPRRRCAHRVGKPPIGQQSQPARAAKLVEQIALAAEQRIASQQHVEPLGEQFARRRAAEQEQIRRRAPDERRTRCAEPRKRRAFDPDAVHRDQSRREKPHSGEPRDLTLRRRADALRNMHAKARRGAGDREFRRHAQRVGTVDAHDAQRKVALEVLLPAIVMDDGGDAGEQVLPRAGEQRLAARNRMARGDPRPMPALDVARPCIGVAIGRRAQPAIMVAVQMVVRVDQAGADMRIGEIEPDVEIAHGLDQHAAVDRDRTVRRADQGAHPASFTKDRASTVGSPRSRSYDATRPARS